MSDLINNAADDDLIEFGSRRTVPEGDASWGHCHGE